MREVIRRTSEDFACSLVPDGFQRRRVRFPYADTGSVKRQLQTLAQLVIGILALLEQGDIRVGTHDVERGAVLPALEAAAAHHHPRPRARPFGAARDRPRHR